MTQIRIAKKVEEFEGEIINGKVTLFGTSAHIPFSKKHLGKKVKVIIPEESEYVWVLSEKERKDFVKACLDELKKQKETKMTFYKKSAIESVAESSFEIEDIANAVGVLEGNKKYKLLIQKINKAYNLKS